MELDFVDLDPIYMVIGALSIVYLGFQWVVFSHKDLYGLWI